MRPEPWTREGAMHVWIEYHADVIIRFMRRLFLR
jgi:hypothetical protein